MAPGRQNMTQSLLGCGQLLGRARRLRGDRRLRGYAELCLRQYISGEYVRCALVRRGHEELARQVSSLHAGRRALAHPARQVLEQARTAMTGPAGTKCINEGCCEDAKQLHAEAAGLTVNNGATQGFGEHGGCGEGLLVKKLDRGTRSAVGAGRSVCHGCVDDGWAMTDLRRSIPAHCSQFLRFGIVIATATRPGRRRGGAPTHLAPARASATVSWQLGRAMALARRHRDLGGRTVHAGRPPHGWTAGPTVIVGPNWLREEEEARRDGWSVSCATRATVRGARRCRCPPSSLPPRHPRLSPRRGRGEGGARPTVAPSGASRPPSARTRTTAPPPAAPPRRPPQTRASGGM